MSILPCRIRITYDLITGTLTNGPALVGSVDVVNQGDIDALFD
jgi:hypothetical protein